MKLPNITGLMKIGKNFVMTYRPELLLGAAVTSAVGGAVLAAKGGYEARGIIDAERLKRVASPEPPYDTFLEFYEEFIEKADPISLKEQFQLTWLCYLPAAVTVTTSVGSIGGLHLVHVKEKKALATAALAAIEEVKSESKQFLKDNTVGIMSEEEKEKVLEHRLENDSRVIAEYADGELEEKYLVRDGKTGRDIWSNKQRIEEAVLTVNNWIAKHGDCDINSFYENAGFDVIPEGQDWGWSGAFVELNWDTTVRDDGRPVRRFAFRSQPKENYDGSGA